MCHFPTAVRLSFSLIVGAAAAVVSALRFSTTGLEAGSDIIVNPSTGDHLYLMLHIFSKDRLSNRIADYLFDRPAYPVPSLTSLCSDVTLLFSHRSPHSTQPLDATSYTSIHSAPSVIHTTYCCRHSLVVYSR